ncbi:hypothetical protein [Streptomyces sp. NPDC001568]|uniref:hypothetical protein n=1 Tax=Streptomyces sp. NPDC001568 TaxID=3364588 RepID=UPI00369AB769
MAHTMVLAVSPHHLEQLDALVTSHRDAEEQWMRDQSARTDLPLLRGSARRDAQARIRAARQKHRDTGRHRPTRALALAPALRVELDARGLLRDWDPIPAGAPTSGQTLGGRGPHTGAGLTARLVVALPDELWVPLTRGVHWTNQPHLQALQTWTDRWGPGPAAGHSTAPAEALAERARSAAHITTTGEIIRTALEHTLHPGP